jgi:hypothetical protein
MRRGLPGASSSAGPPNTQAQPPSLVGETGISTFESEPQTKPDENRAGQAVDPSQSAFEPAA